MTHHGKYAVEIFKDEYFFQYIRLKVLRCASGNPVDRCAGAGSVCDGPVCLHEEFFNGGPSCFRHVNKKKILSVF